MSKHTISLASRKAERYRKATVKAVAPAGYADLDSDSDLDTAAAIRERYDRDGDKIALELLEEWGAVERYTKDAAGREHKPAGNPEGGQFVSKEEATKLFEEAEAKRMEWMKANPNPQLTLGFPQQIPKGTPNQKALQKEINDAHYAPGRAWDARHEQIKQQLNWEFLKKQKVRADYRSEKEDNRQKHAKAITALEWAQKHAGLNREAEQAITSIELGYGSRDGIHFAWFPGASAYVQKALRKAGGKRTHTSESSGSHGSVYYTLPGGREIRLTDHELPWTPQRESNYEQFGRPKWHEIVLDKIASPQEIDAMVKRGIEGEPENEDTVGDENESSTENASQLPPHDAVVHLANSGDSIPPASQQPSSEHEPQSAPVAQDQPGRPPALKDNQHIDSSQGPTTGHKYSARWENPLPGTAKAQFSQGSHSFPNYDQRERREQYARPTQWQESKHERGQPDNAGQFGPGGATPQQPQPKPPNAHVNQKQPEPPEAKSAKPLTIGGKVFDAFQNGKDWFFRTTPKANWVKAKPHAAKVLSEKAMAVDPQAAKEQQWKATQAELQKHVLGHVALAQRRHDIAQAFVDSFNQSFWGSIGLGKKPTQQTRRQAEQQQARLTRSQRQLERSKARAQVVARQHAALSKALNRNLKEFGLDFDPAIGRTLNEQEFRAHQRTLREVARQEAIKHKEKSKGERQAQRLALIRSRQQEADEARQERVRLAEERRQQKRTNPQSRKPKETPQPEPFVPFQPNRVPQRSTGAADQKAFGFADADVQIAKIAAQMHEAQKANARATVTKAPGAIAQDNAMQRAVKEALAKGKIKAEHMPTAITKDESREEKQQRETAAAESKKQQAVERRRAAKEHREAEIHEQQQAAGQAAEEVGLDPDEFQSYAADVAQEMHGEDTDNYNDEYQQLLKSSGLTADKIEEIENQGGTSKEGEAEGHKRGDAALHVDDALMTQWPKMFPNLGLPQDVTQHDVVEAIKRGPRETKQWYSPDVVAETKRRIEAVKPGPDWEPGMDDDVDDDGEFAHAGAHDEGESIPFQKAGTVYRYSLDASGHEHRGKGDRGGQFVGHGTSSDATDVRPIDDEPASTSPNANTAHQFDTPNRGGGDTSIASKLSNGKIKDVHSTVKSGINSSFIIETEDGAQGVLKPAYGETEGLRPDIPAGTYWRREIAASKIAELMDMGDLVPLTVHRKIRDGDASVQAFCDDSSVSSAMPRRQAFDGPADAARAMVFDFIVGNTDRHRGNWMLQKGDKLKLIDNGLCFPEKHGETSLLGISQLQNRLADHYHDLDLSTAVQAWSDKLPEVEKALREAGISQAAIERTAQRHAIMMKHSKYGHAFNELKAMQE